MPNGLVVLGVNRVQTLDFCPQLTSRGAIRFKRGGAVLATLVAMVAGQDPTLRHVGWHPEHDEMGTRSREEAMVLVRKGAIEAEPTKLLR